MVDATHYSPAVEDYCNLKMKKGWDIYRNSIESLGMQSSAIKSGGKKTWN